MTHRAPTSQDLESFAIAVAAGRVAEVEAFLERHGDECVKLPVSREIKSITRSPLGWAAIYGHVPMMRLLLSRGADINQPSNQLDTPLMNAVMWNRGDALRFLLDAGAALSPKDKLGKTALDYALDEGKRDMAAQLREAQVNIVIAAFAKGSCRPGKAGGLKIVKAVKEAKPPLL